MLEKIRWNDIHRAEQVDAFVKEARRMISEYGWEDETVFAYSFPTKVTDMIDRLEDIWEYERSSKELIIAEVNGLVPIMNRWEQSAIEDANSPQVTIRLTDKTLKEGELVTLPERTAKQLIEWGVGEAV